MPINSRISYSQNVNISNDNEELSFDIGVQGTLIKLDGKIYLNVPHAGLNVKTIKFNGKEYKDIKYSEWSENMIVEIKQDDIFENQYIFKKLRIRNVEVSQKIKLNNYYCDYIKNEYFPVNMMPNNPNLMHYVIKSEEDGFPEMGTPLHYNGTLFGIYNRYNKEKNHCYVIPSIFIKKSIINKTNKLKICQNINDIKKIGKYKIQDTNFIYCPQLDSYIEIDTLLLYISNDKNKTILNNTADRFIKFKSVSKKALDTTFILHWCKMFHIEKLKEILSLDNTRCNTRNKQIEIYGVNYSLFI